MGDAHGSSDMGADLLPCPFCGGEARTARSHEYWSVYCTKCFASTVRYLPTGPYFLRDESRAEAVARWDRRGRS